MAVSKDSLFVKVLRVWVGLIGITALGNTISSYLNGELLSETIFTQKPELVNALVGRLFGTWTLLSAFVRVLCAVHIDSKPLYEVSMFSFLLAFAYFASELYIFKTIHVTFGPLSALVISTISFVLMLVGYPRLFQRQSTGRAKRR
ncbi:ergosterol biosynthetic protein 28 homolog [Amphiura filiformis]|uniref:ergosterol biosynthetic protein 28 homolog n=1 Tax=Amphiura filiformis TaxID=82378 RepID=UPI003B211A84